MSIVRDVLRTVWACFSSPFATSVFEEKVYSDGSCKRPQQVTLELRSSDSQATRADNLAEACMLCMVNNATKAMIMPDARKRVLDLLRAYERVDQEWLDQCPVVKPVPMPPAGATAAEIAGEKPANWPQEVLRSRGLMADLNDLVREKPIGRRVDGQSDVPSDLTSSFTSSGVRRFD